MIDFVVCDADPCKCSPASDPDACCCEAAAGAELVDGVPCAKCGAPLDVVEAPEPSSAPRIQRVMMGIGRITLPPRLHVWWGGAPIESDFRAERFVIGFGNRDELAARRGFAVRLHAWRVGDLLFHFAEMAPELAPELTREKNSALLHPLHYGVVLRPGQAIELEVENIGDTALEAAGCLVGTAVVQKPAAGFAPRG